jgi:hypothetical protein
MVQPIDYCWLVSLLLRAVLRSNSFVYLSPLPILEHARKLSKRQAAEKHPKPTVTKATSDDATTMRHNQSSDSLSP